MSTPHSFFKFILAIKFILFFFIIQPIPANSQPNGNGWHACITKYDATSCQAYASVDEASIRIQPDRSSASIRSLSSGDIIILHDPFGFPENSDWLPTEVVIQGKAMQGWAPKSDILLNWQFHKVVNCWPISHLEWSERNEGDVPSRTYRAMLEPSGKTTIYARIDDQGPRLNKFERLNNDFAIYFAKGLFRLADIKKKNQEGWLFSLFKLDNNSGEVSIKDLDNIYKLLVVKKYSKDELKSRRCSLMPEVDEKWSLLPKPRRR